MKTFLYYLLPFLFIPVSCNDLKEENNLPRVIISTDIGGSDPDDYQSMVHLLVYADRFDIEGIISSPPFEGRAEHIEEVLHAYAQDYENLKKHAKCFPHPDSLFNVTKQGAVESQEDQTPQGLSEGAEWMIKKAKEDVGKPLYVLVWGSITDVAQAVHEDPEIKNNLRVYSIGSWIPFKIKKPGITKSS